MALSHELGTQLSSSEASAVGHLSVSVVNLRLSCRLVDKLENNDYVEKPNVNYDNKTSTQNRTSYYSYFHKTYI